MLKRIIFRIVHKLTGAYLIKAGEFERLKEIEGKWLNRKDPMPADATPTGFVLGIPVWPHERDEFLLLRQLREACQIDEVGGEPGRIAEECWTRYRS